MKTLFIYFSLIMVLVVGSVVQAQPEENVTYTADDLTFSVEYPAQWSFNADAETGFYYLQRDDLHVTLYTPAVLDAYLIGNIADPAILTGLVMAVNDVTETSVDETVLNGRPAAIYHYQNEATANKGLLTAIQFDDGRLGLVDAYSSSDVSLFMDDILSIAATFDIPPVPAPEELANDASLWQDAVGELIESEFIPSGGNLVFVQPSAFTVGTGVRFQGLAQQTAHQNVVVAGSLTYSASASAVDETCALVAHFVDEDNYLAVGQDANGAVFAADFVGGSVENSDSVDRGLISDETYRFLFIALDDRLIVYLDGQLVIDDLRIAERAGSYGLILRSLGSAGCAVNDMWAYVLPEVAEAVDPNACQIIANANVNQRSGAGVEFDLLGQLLSGSGSTAVGRSIGTDGLVWWQLSDGSWVREDVVTASGECESLPLTN